MPPDIHERAAAGFSRNARDYERSRPSYPSDAVAHLARVLELHPGRVVADVAAGTGKLTRLLVSTGATVIAVEPVTEMRAFIGDGVTVLDGTAEHLPFADNSLDAITVAQAFHWFDGPAALREFHRVLRPGGGLAVVYNDRDVSVPWMTQINDLMSEWKRETPDHYGDGWADAFGQQELFTPLEQASFDNPQELTPDGVLGRFRSLSYVGRLDDDRQAALLAQIGDVVRTHPATAGRETIVVPQTTNVWTCSAI